MNVESENTKAHAARFEDGPPAVVPEIEIGHITVDRLNSSPEHLECQSRLNDSPQQHETREVNVVAKESWADWGVVACVLLSNLLASIDYTGFGVFYPFLVEHFEATTAAVGLCSSVSGFFQAVVAIFASYPIESYGCRLPGVVGSLLYSIGLSLSYLSPNLLTIYFTYGVIAGSGSGIAMLSTSIIVHQRFTRNRNLASGIANLGYGLGGIVGPILINHLIQWYSWRGAFLIFGAIQTQRILLCLFFRTPKRLTSQSKNASGTRSQIISGQLILKYLKETFNFSIFRQVRYSLYSIAFFLQVFCYGGYMYHMMNRAIHIGLSRGQGVTAMALMGILSTVTRLPISFIANLRMVNSSLIFAVGMFFAFLSIVIIIINPGIIATMTSAVLFGMHIGCTIPVISIIAVDLMGVALLPKSSALLQFIAGLAILVSPPLVGWVYDVTRDYNKAFAIIGCMAFVSGCLMVILTVVTRCHRNSVAKDIEFPLSDNGAENPPKSES